VNKTHITFGKANSPTPTTVHPKKRSDKFNKQLMIYLGGYATHRAHTVDDYFYAREYVMARKHLIPRF